MSRSLLTRQQEARFRRNIREREDGCWEWVGTIHARSGYGSITLGPRGASKQYRAHRLAYLMWVGQIPDDMSLDHACHSEALAEGTCAGGPTCMHRRCVNPAHMEPMTQRENVLRGAGLAAVNARKTRCTRGHEFSEANTHIRRDGGRVCRACARAKSKAYAERQARLKAA